MTAALAPPRRKRKWPPLAPPFRGSPTPRFPAAAAAAEGERGVMAFSAPAAYLTHQQKVLRLYKRALRHLESWCVHR